MSRAGREGTAKRTWVGRRGGNAAGAGTWYVLHQQLPVTNDNGDSVSCAGRGVRFEMEMGSFAVQEGNERGGLAGRGMQLPLEWKFSTSLTALRLCSSRTQTFLPHPFSLPHFLPFPLSHNLRVSISIYIYPCVTCSCIHVRACHILILGL